MKQSIKCRTTMAAITGLVLCGTLLNFSPDSALAPAPAHAGVLDQIRDSIGSLWSQKQNKQSAARAARTRATQFKERAAAVHDRLESAQQLLQASTENYHNYWRQMKRTEAQIVKTRHRVQIVTVRYRKHRKLFGQRLAVMQRTGKLNYLNMVLGSRTLSDLSRRQYVFHTLADRDSELQKALREDKQELEQAQNALMSQWNERNHLQRVANRERERIANAEKTHRQLLYTLNNSRDAQLAYAMAQQQSAQEVEGMIHDLTARRQAIIDAYEEQAARERAARRSYRSERTYTRRYRRQRVARRVQRVRYVRQAGGELKPMPIQEVIYRDEMVPVDEAGGSLSEGLSVEEDHRGHDHDDGWHVPVRGRNSSRYGMRYHPILRRRKLHTGADMAARQGTPIKAARNGRVLYSGWKKGYGNTVIIDHGDGVSTLYGHASKVAAKPGQPVKAGEYIGNVGSTGYSTGPHLHFEVRKNGKPVNPAPYLKGKR